MVFLALTKCGVLVSVRFHDIFGPNQVWCAGVCDISCGILALTKHGVLVCVIFHVVFLALT